MSSLSEYEASLRRQVKLSLMQCDTKGCRINQLSGLLAQAMSMVRMPNSHLEQRPLT
jgi:hypothetical protein